MNKIKKEFIASYEIGDIVYHRASGEKGIVTGYNIDKRDVVYRISFAYDAATFCYAIEISEEPPISYDSE